MYYTWHAAGLMTAQRWNRRQASAKVGQGTAVRRPVPLKLASKVPDTDAKGSRTEHGVREAVRATSTAARMRDAEGFLGDAAFSMRLADRAEQELERI